MTIRRLAGVLVVLSAGLSLPACLHLPAVVPNPSSTIKEVAVLPVVNNTNDVDAPAAVREWLASEIEGHFYDVQSVKKTDRLLKEQASLTLGSQLNLIEPKKLCELLKVSGLLYGSLEEFTLKVTGVYNVGRVRVRAKLVECQTGQTVWKNGIGVKRILYAGTIGALASIGSMASDKGAGDELPPLLGDPIAAPWVELQAEDAGGLVQGVVRGVGEKLVSKATGGELEGEVINAVRIMYNGYMIKGFSTEPCGTMIPSGPGA